MTGTYVSLGLLIDTDSTFTTRTGTDPRPFGVVDLGVDYGGAAIQGDPASLRRLAAALNLAADEVDAATGQVAP